MWDVATTPLRRGLLALSAPAVTMVMAARSDVPVKSETFPGDSSICVFSDSDTGLYSFANLNLSDGESADPKHASWCSYPATATANSIDSITMPPGKMLLSRHRHGTKTRNHNNVAELIFPHCVRVQARGCSLREINRILSLYPLSTSVSRLC
jgi:hypothetical protein